MYRCQRGSKFSALQRKSLENFSLSSKIHGRNVPFVKEKSSSPIPQNREICFFSNLHLPLLRLVLCKLLKHNASGKTGQGSADCAESQSYEHLDRRVKGKRS